MRFNSTNCQRGAKVHDVDANAEIKFVLELNAGAGWVLVADQPPKASQYGQVISRRIRFRSIYAIQGLESMPCLFHCYGREQSQA
ncbi:hypothetical protein N5C96_23335 [Delftia tsuruhatensis]|uniref:hypothetical protein n=1 Tax=Delftia tsuruhatensis TaxID=180282 RepID=UPI002443E592|nr:hypothetical protein [Delftia tsuruhatensis]MDH0776347.1 hypothetical protein [Delftia tsuruhatensis]MDH1460098.1 hypothetical protein [Delftia tsuruhatensis]MDH1823061.1 hypothetical protein [Delftia tsuruhatensis]WGG12267.1 hypothetical protein N5O86_06385 [Delftia tsuruhatensis]